MIGFMIVVSKRVEQFSWHGPVCFQKIITNRGDLGLYGHVFDHRQRCVTDYDVIHVIGNIRDSR